MADPQHAPAEGDRKPVLDLEAQLDSLLAKIDEHAAEAQSAAGEPSVAAEVPAEVHEPALAVGGAHQDSGAATAPPTEDDLAGDALARQIQELLDDAKQAEEQGHTPGAAPAPLPSGVPATHSDQDQIDGLIASMAQGHQSPPAGEPTVSPVAAPSAELAGPPQPPEAREPPSSNPIPARQVQIPSLKSEAPPAVLHSAALEQIDTELAAGAEDAIAGDFETPEQAMATGGTAVAAPGAAAAPVGNAGDADTHVEPPREAAHDDVQLDVEGAFESPEDLLRSHESPPAPSPAVPAPAPLAARQAEPVPIGQTPGGQAVADELDREARPRATPPAAPKRQPRPRPRRTWRPRLTALLRAIPITPQGIKNWLAAINSPLLDASAQTRDTLGYVALVTLFLAIATITYRAVHGPIKPRERVPAAMTVAAAPPEGSAEGGEGTPPPKHAAARKPAQARKPAKVQAASEE